MFVAHATIFHCFAHDKMGAGVRACYLLGWGLKEVSHRQNWPWCWCLVCEEDEVHHWIHSHCFTVNEAPEGLMILFPTVSGDCRKRWSARQAQALTWRNRLYSIPWHPGGLLPGSQDPKTNRCSSPLCKSCSIVMQPMHILSHAHIISRWLC